MPTRSPGSETAAATEFRGLSLGPDRFEQRAEARPTEGPVAVPRSATDWEPPRATTHRVELETLGQGRLQLRMTETGSELRIEARELGTALSGTEAGWQDLRDRLGESGVILGPLQPGDSQPDTRREAAHPEPRHAVCYEGSSNESDRHRDPSGFQARGGGKPLPDPVLESASDPRSEGPRVRRAQGREWWA